MCWWVRNPRLTNAQPLVLSFKLVFWSWFYCERVAHRHGAILLIVRVRTGLKPRQIRHCGSWCARQRTGRQWRESRGARERTKTKQGNNQRTLKHVTSWMAYGWSECARCDTLSHNVSEILGIERMFTMRGREAGDCSARPKGATEHDCEANDWSVSGSGRPINTH